MKINRLYMMIVLAVTMVGAAVWMVFTPDCIEDLAMRFIDIPVGLSSEPINSLSSLAHGLWSFITYDNSRLANLMYICLATLPDIVTDLLCAASVAGGLWMLIRLSAQREPSPAFTALTTLLYFSWLPWYDRMEVSDYQLNYVVSSFMALVAIHLFRRERMVPTIALTFFAAWMHEALAVALIAFFATSWLISRSRLSLCAGVASIIGFAITMASGTIHRIANAAANQPASLPIILLSAFAVIVFTIVFILNIKTRRIDMEKMMPIAAAIVATSACALYAHIADRAFWFADVFALLGILSYSGSIRASRPTNVISWIFLVGYAMFWINVAVWEHRVGDEQRTINKEVNEGKSIIFADVTNNFDIPWWTFDFVNARHHNYTANHILSATSGTGADLHAVLPARFSSLEFSEWDKIPGDNPFRGAIPYMLSTEDFDIDQVEIEVGEPTISKPLYLRAFTLISSPRRNTVCISRSRILTATGDSLNLYILQIDSPRRFSDRFAADRQILAVNMIR